MSSRSFIASTFLSLVSVGLLVVGCSSSKEDAPRVSRKGEACQTTANCAGDLSCVPSPGGSGGVCVNGEFKVTATAKECAVVQCSQASDCCPTKPASLDCADLEQSCQMGSQFACTQHAQYCRCDGSKFACESGTCRAQCSSNFDCGTGTCLSGKCVACSTDTDCGTDQTCNDGKCEEPCKTDVDCPLFNRCANGKCADSGCKTDRECVAATRNVEATWVHIHHCGSLSRPTPEVA